MTEIIVDTDFEDKRWEKTIPNLSEIVEQLKTATFGFVARHDNPQIFKADKPLLLHLCLSDDKHVHDLNREFRHVDKPTNVLSFANMDFDEFDKENMPFAEIDLGSIIIAYETTLKEAEAEGITLYAHFSHLLVHGMLHVLGFDHQKPSEAEHMESYEKAVLAEVGIADPYKNFE